MADEKDKTFTSAVELSARDLQALDPAVLKDLQEQHGLEIQVRSNSTAINKILEGIGRPAGLRAVADFTRGFDRTSPGYDKYYNRDYAMRDPLEQVVLPLYYGDPAGWLQVMRGAIGKNASRFNSHHMMRRYAAEAYLR